jgi:hypothetical protein
MTIFLDPALDDADVRPTRETAEASYLTRAIEQARLTARLAAFARGAVVPVPRWAPVDGPSIEAGSDPMRDRAHGHPSRTIVG